MKSSPIGRPSHRSADARLRHRSNIRKRPRTRSPHLGPCGNTRVAEHGRVDCSSGPNAGRDPRDDRPGVRNSTARYWPLLSAAYAHPPGSTAAARSSAINATGQCAVGRRGGSGGISGPASLARVTPSSARRARAEVDILPEASRDARASPPVAWQRRPYPGDRRLTSAIPRFPARHHNAVSLPPRAPRPNHSLLDRFPDARSDLSSECARWPWRRPGDLRDFLAMLCGAHSRSLRAAMRSASSSGPAASSAKHSRRTDLGAARRPRSAGPTQSDLTE